MKDLIKINIILFFFFGPLLDNICADTQEKILIVTEAVANLRKEPIDAKKGNAHDDGQETQVLYNEPLIYRGENEGWYLVEAVEQQEFSHHQTWEGYPGWVKKKNVKLIDKIPQYNFIVREKTAEVFSKPAATAKILFIVSLGTQFQVIDAQDEFYKVNLADKSIGWLKKKDLNKIEAVDKDIAREEIIAVAKEFLGTPYLWGGRSMYIPGIKTTATGVDCSGLTSMAYRANNISIPRDAYEQWMVSKKISSDEIKTGDLIFISTKDDRLKIVHVMLYIDGERFIESSGTGNLVSIKTFQDKFGFNLAELIKRDFLVDGKKIYFGRIEF